MRGTIRPFTIALATTTLAALAISAGAQSSQSDRHTSAPAVRATADRADALADHVYLRLADRAWAGGDFKITTSDGAVTIAGTVPSQEARLRVLRVIRRTPGVSDVRDQLRIAAAPKSVASVPDAQLNERVAKQIAAAIPNTKAGEDWWFSGWRVEARDNEWNLTVDSDDGKVTLDGDVPRVHIAREAVEAALHANGVQSVRSDMDVESRQPGHVVSGAYHGSANEWRRGAYLPDTATFKGLEGVHMMSGQVTAVDHESGRLSMRTDEGTLDLHFPPSSIKDVDKGDGISVELGFREQDRTAVGG
jgi:osmotically-inducible protein OsmY